MNKVDDRADYTIKPDSKDCNKLNSENWLILLKNYAKLKTKTTHFAATRFGSTPLDRPIKEYIKSGYINLDKLPGQSPDQVASRIRDILRVEKACHSGGLFSKKTNCLIVCIERAVKLFVSKKNSDTVYISDNLVTMSDVLDAQWKYDNQNDETYLRNVIQPLEQLLILHKRIVVKDSAVYAICSGAKIVLPAVLKFEDNILLNEEIVIITTKGEAICLAIALMTSSSIESCDHGAVAKTKRVLMERDLYKDHVNNYSRRQGPGKITLLKKRLIAEGLLSKKGKPTEKTPSEWYKLTGTVEKKLKIIEEKIEKEEEFTVGDESKSEAYLGLKFVIIITCVLIVVLIMIVQIQFS